jgi:peptide/nickel transport system ATP-binding protein
MAENLLEVCDLAVSFRTDEGEVPAVDGVSFELPAGGTLGIVGESGCGKSVTALSILRLLPVPPARIRSGQVLFEGRNLLALSEARMRRLRGNELSMIFQEPMTSLNPVHTVGRQIVEAIRQHRDLSRGQARARAVEMLELVGIPAAAERVDAYPHEMSGGMRQRVMIAMALACEPRLLIADEPTTALDVTIQAQILELLKDLQRRLGMSIILITHDLGVVAEFVDEIVVMYAGKVAERARTEALFEAPRHPYTRGLLMSVPTFEDNARQRRLPTIPGMVPDLRELPVGCRYQDRCPDVVERCRHEDPPLERLEGGGWVACHVATGAARPGPEAPSEDRPRAASGERAPE